MLCIRGLGTPCWRSLCCQRGQVEGAVAHAWYCPCTGFVGFPSLSHGCCDTGRSGLLCPPVHDRLPFQNCAKINLSSVFFPGKYLAIG